MNRLLRLLRNAFIALHASLYRAPGGRIGNRMAGLDVLLLTTTGRRSGGVGTVPLGHIREGAAYVVIASNGGSDRHPAWYLNLHAQPRARIRVGTYAIDVLAETTRGEQRAGWWGQIVAAEPRYAGYAAALRARSRWCC